MCNTFTTHIKPILGFLVVMFNLGAFSQDIAAPELDGGIANVCVSASNNNVGFSFTFSGTSFNSDNNFIIELSDADGNFDNPTNIGTLTDPDLNFAFVVENVNFILPTTTAGDNYRIQVRGTSPEVTSLPSNFFGAYYQPNVVLRLNDNEDPFLCDGEAIDVSVGELGAIDINDYNFAWFKDDVRIANENGSTLTITEEGFYYVGFDLGDLCTLAQSSFSNRIEVESLSLDALSILGDDIVEICSNEEYELVSSLDDSDFVYQWYKDDELITGLADYQVSYTTPDADQFGVYRLDILAGGCITSSQEVTIQQETGADFVVTIDSATTRVLLPGDNIALNVEVTPTSSDLTYRWFKDGEELFGNDQSEFNITSDGEYFVIVTDNSSTCPVSLNSELYTVLDAVSLVPVIITSLDYEECNSLVTTLNLVGVDVLATDNEQYTLSSEQLATFNYQWYKDGDVVPSESFDDPTNTDSLEIESYLDNGEYFLDVFLVGSDITGNSNLINVLLTPGLEIASSSVSNTLCIGSVIDFSIEILDDFTYTWFKDDEVLIVDDPSTIEVTEIGVYYVVYEGAGCSNETSRIEVLEFEEDVFVVSPLTTAVLIAEETTTLSASGADSYEWQSEDGTVVSSNATLEVSITGIYTVIGVVGDCVVEKEIEVVPDDGSYSIPNILSPFNQDGVNDTWEIPNKFAYQADVQVIIYTSKGIEVFNTTDYQNNWPEGAAIRGGQLFYFKVLQEDSLLKAGTISVLD